MGENNLRSWKPSRRLRRTVAAAAAVGALLGGVTVAAAFSGTASPRVVNLSETESETLESTTTSSGSTTTEGATTTAASSTTTAVESDDLHESDESHEGDDPTTTASTGATTTGAPTSTTACAESDDEAEDDEAEGDEAEGDEAEGDESEGDESEGDESEGDEAEDEDEGEEADSDEAESDDDDCEADEQEAELKTLLSGANEVPANTLGGRGQAEIEIEGSTVCWQVDFETTTPAVAAHIHFAPVGVNGPVVVPLEPLNPQGKSEACVTIDATLAANIAAHPEQYYVNVHTTALPAGDVRGQLHGDD